MKRFVLALALLLFPAQALAVTATDRYVNTDCANNGDGTASSCAASNGAAGAYNSQQNASTDIQSDFPNLVSADRAITVHCKGTAADTSEPIWENLVTDATRTITVTVDVADRHDGKWNTSKYRLVNGNYFAALQVKGIKYFTASWMQIEQNRTGSSGGTEGSGIDTRGQGLNGGKWVFEGNIIRYTGDYVNVSATGFEDDVNDTNLVKVFRNNVILYFKRGGYFRTGDDGSYYLFNNTCYSNEATGDICIVIRDYGSGTITYVAKNNLANGTLQGYDISGNGVYTHSNNLSEDTSSPDNTLDSKAVTFVNEGGGDFHLASADTAAKDAGADLSGVTNGFTVDIDTQTRSGTWDVGADEYQSTGSAVAAVVSISH